MARRAIRRRRDDRPVINKVGFKGSKSFAEIREGDDYWIDNELRRYKGVSFIKVFPPSDATEDQIAATKRSLKEMGIEVVKVMPKASSVRSVSRVERVDRKSIRSTVIEYAKGLAVSTDKDSLILELNTVMDQVGI